MRSFSRWLHESSFVRIVAGFLLAAAALAACGWLLTGPYKGLVAGFDSNIRYTMRQIQSPMWTSLFLTVTKLGSTLYMIIIGCTAGIIFLLLRWFRATLLLILVMAGQAALHHGAKWLFARPRPPALINYPAESFSFPSGHALGAVCLYGMIAWLVATQLENAAAKAGIAIFTAIMIFLIGTSRVYIGIHYPTDVVAGLIGGIIWTAAVISIDRRPL